MTANARARLRKVLEKTYWANDQRFYVTSMELLDGHNDCGPFSICAYDSHRKAWGDWLFDVQNYDAFWEYNHLPTFHIRHGDKLRWYARFDSNKAACAMFYDTVNRLYTIPKFGNITVDEIMFCLEHFLKKELEAYCLFNKKWYQFPEEQVQAITNKDLLSVGNEEKKS